MTYIFIIVLTVAINVIIILILSASQISMVIKMLYNNWDNLFLKFKSLIASNETYLSIGKILNYISKLKKK